MVHRVLKYPGTVLRSVRTTVYALHAATYRHPYGRLLEMSKICH